MSRLGLGQYKNTILVSIKKQNSDIFLQKQDTFLEMALSLKNAKSLKLLFMLNFNQPIFITTFKTFTVSQKTIVFETILEIILFLETNTDFCTWDEWNFKQNFNTVSKKNFLDLLFQTTKNTNYKKNENH